MIGDFFLRFWAPPYGPRYPFPILARQILFQMKIKPVAKDFHSYRWRDTEGFVGNKKKWEESIINGCHKKKPIFSDELCGDLDWIQTSNLLSRNQVRYSVAPRGHIQNRNNISCFGLQI